MAEKRLFDLLQVDQEPFLLHSYIQNLRFQLNKPYNSEPHLFKHKPLSNSKASIISSNLCNHTCLFCKSPQADFQSKTKNTNSILLHIPSRTASLLLESAVRIQKRSSSNRDSTKFKPRRVRSGFVFFGSMLKKLTRWDRSRTEKIKQLDAEEEPKSASGSGYSFNESRVNGVSEWEDFDYCEKRFCERNFRFAFEKNDSRTCGRPRSRATEGRQSDDEEECSPVSTLDSTFNCGNEHVDNAFGIGRNIERKKQHLLKKLFRFEQLAGLHVEKGASGHELDDDYCDDEDYNHRFDGEEECEAIISNIRRREIVWTRLKKWKLYEVNTVDFTGNEFDGWEKNQEEVGDTILDIEVHILGFLVEELLEELLHIP